MLNARTHEQSSYQVLKQHLTVLMTDMILHLIYNHLSQVNLIVFLQTKDHR